jgi:hypothetical protein
MSGQELAMARQQFQEALGVQRLLLMEAAWG